MISVMVSIGLLPITSGRHPIILSLDSLRVEVIDVSTVFQSCGAILSSAIVYLVAERMDFMSDWMVPLHQGY